MRYYIYLIIFSFLVFSCSVHPPEKPIPTWVQERPMDPFNYTGIAKIEKALHPNDYKQVAKKAALNDLASEISIKIASNSLISSYDDNSGFQSDYSQFIKTEINKDLSGYQMQGEYEDKKIYYVYYQLSKSKWAQIQNERKQIAADKAYSIYQQAQKEEKALHYKFAITQYTNALLSIKKYWNETLNYKTKEGTEIHLDNKIKEDLLRILKDIKIYTAPAELTLNSENNYQENLKISVRNNKGEYLASFPIELSYKQLNAPKIIHFVSDIKAYNVLINKVDYKLTNNFVQVKIPKTKLFNFKAEDRIFLQFIKDAFGANVVNVPIQHIAPSVYIQKDDKNPFIFYLNQKIQEGLSNGHLKVSENKNKSDYTISINTKTTKSSNTQKFKIAFLNYNINIYKTSNNQLIYTKTITRVKGVGLSFEKAIEKAYLKAADDIENEYIDEIITAFF